MISESIKKILDLLESPSPVSEHPDENEIGAWRDRIDDIDQILLALLNERSRAANVIGVIKKKLDIPVYVPRRESEVLELVRKANRGPLPDNAVRHLFERIIDETRSLERQLASNESETETPRTDPFRTTKTSSSE